MHEHYLCNTWYNTCIALTPIFQCYSTQPFCLCSGSKQILSFLSLFLALNIHCAVPCCSEGMFDIEYILFSWCTNGYVFTAKQQARRVAFISSEMIHQCCILVFKWCVQSYRHTELLVVSPLYTVRRRIYRLEITTQEQRWEQNMFSTCYLK